MHVADGVGIGLAWHASMNAGESRSRRGIGKLVGKTLTWPRRGHPFPGGRRENLAGCGWEMATATETASAAAPQARPAEPLDTTVRLVTPERITFAYPLAGPFRRALAYLIDLFVCVMLMVLAVFAARLLAFGDESAGNGLVLVAFFVLQWGFAATCEAVFNGRTPGKKVLRLRVVSAEGTPITAAQAFLRNLTWTIEGLWPFALTPALASTVLTRRFQRLGDLAAGTMVVVEERAAPSRMPRPMDGEIATLLEQLPRHVEAGPELAQALADYVKHRGRFGKGRREEMAAHLARPVRLRYGLAAESSGDAVLCALYHRVFLEG